MNSIRPLKKFLAANSSDANFTLPADTLTEPTGDGVIDLSASGNGVVPCGIALWPYGLGSDNDAFSLRVIGWSRIQPAVADGRWQWVPTILAEVSAICCTDVGVAGGQVGATERYTDTLVIVTEATVTQLTTREGTVWLTNPGANIRSHFIVPLEGIERVSLKFDQTTGTPTMNALYRLIDEF